MKVPVPWRAPMPQHFSSLKVEMIFETSQSYTWMELCSLSVSKLQRWKHAQAAMLCGGGGSERRAVMLREPHAAACLFQQEDGMR